ncbi:MAG: hypothetical protein IT348_05810 [Candidatus Eisenbacteria bacterium]|nr:hypothetical protein [Candidatus Eisenbacteria bacterium]
MSRSSYSDDYDDFPGQSGLFRANVRRSIRSARGQARLRELRDALLAMPVKELNADVFVEGEASNPAVCALGQWALTKAGGDVEAAQEMAGVDPECDESTAEALAVHGWPKLVVLETICENDDARPRVIEVHGPSIRPWDYGYRWGGVRYVVPETPAERYARMLAWVEERIAADPQTGGTR